MINIWRKFVGINYKFHIFLALLIRIAFVQYGIYHDQNSTVAYTDIDYKVFTDAARHVTHSSSPYNRHTYRYTPLIALVLTPNLFVDISFGKYLFCVIDLFVGLLLRSIIRNSLREYECYKQRILYKALKQEGKNKSLTDDRNNGQEKREPYIKHGRSRKKIKHSELRVVSSDKKQMKNSIDMSADTGMLIWLYNPLTIAIATRGNCDSISGFLVLLTLYFLQCKRLYFFTGLVHGLAIHVRLYPLMYSLALFMYLSKYAYYSDYRKKTSTKQPPVVVENQVTKEIKVEEKTKETKTVEKNTKHVKNKNIKHEKVNGNKNAKECKELKNMENQIVRDELQTSDSSVAIRKDRKTIFKKQYLFYLIPNIDQIKLILGCLISLSSLTALFYFMYGYQFLHESYFYHLIRKDARHNFSLYFYIQYLTAGIKNIGLWQKILTVLPQIILLLVFSVRYGLNRFTFNFSMLMLTVVMVSYNTVVTSQYFVWILAILPLCLWQIKMATKTAVFLGLIWIAAQGAWLLPAYFLEFRGQNTFIFIWIQGVSFFCANIAILGRLIMNFMPSIQNKVE